MKEMKNNNRPLGDAEKERIGYALHLWDVNSPWYTISECLQICSTRSGVAIDTLKKHLKKTGRD